MIFVSHPK